MFKAEFHDNEFLDAFHIGYPDLYEKMLNKYAAEAKDSSVSYRENLKIVVDRTVCELVKDYYYNISDASYPNYYALLETDFIKRRLVAMSETEEDRYEVRRSWPMLIFGGYLGIQGAPVLIKSLVNLISGVSINNVAPMLLAGILIVAIAAVLIIKGKEKKKRPRRK